ncbi:hypothetical protein QYF36_025635 [Acer negundo]|nr:hypothetical protein QYF36_025635 [Acer negundo]
MGEEDAILEVDDDFDEVDGSDVEPDYEYRPSGLVSDSDTSLVDSLDEGHLWLAFLVVVNQMVISLVGRTHPVKKMVQPECWIKKDRDKPILTLFETLRRKVMVRFTDKWVEIEKLNDTITSYTRNRLNETDNEARKLQVIHGRGEYHETMDSRNKPWLVNICEKTCDCGEWQISGCPCNHALAVLTYNRQHAHDFVYWYYSKEVFQAAYSGAINPIPDASRWPTVDNVPLDPPLRRTLVSRPKKNRRREPDEGR